MQRVSFEPYILGPLQYILILFSSFNSYGDHVQHFKVLKDRDGYYFVWEEVFPSLNQLVEFYKTNSIAKERTVFLKDTEHTQKVRRNLLKFLNCIVRCQSLATIDWTFHGNTSKRLIVNSKNNISWMETDCKINYLINNLILYVFNNVL